MMTVNGEAYTSSPEIKDTDNDNLTDGKEMGVHYGERLENYVRIKREYIGYGEVGYCFYFDAVSNPEEDDSDGDGILDNEDTAPLAKGLEGGIIGEASIVSYHRDGDSFILGHSFILYKSYVNDQFDFSDFYGVYQTQLNQLQEGEFNSIGRIYREDWLENFEISRNEYITFDVASDGIYDESLSESSRRSKSNNNSIFNIYAIMDKLDGGPWVNWEFAQIATYPEEHSDNAAYTLSITEQQLDTIIKSYISKNSYSIYSNNCASRAVAAWNKAFNDNLSAEDFCFKTPQKLKESIKQRCLEKKQEVIAIDIASILREMRFNV